MGRRLRGDWERKIFRIEHGRVAGVVAGAGVEHADEIGECGDAAHRGSRGGRAALLLQGDGGREAVDGVDFGHGELMEEAAGVGRDGFEIAALRLGIEGAEGERGFAGAGDAGEDDEGVAGDVDVDVFEVVLAGSADADHVGGGGGVVDGAGEIHA